MRRTLIGCLLVVLLPTTALARQVEVGVGPVSYRLYGYTPNDGRKPAGPGADLFWIIGRPEPGRAIGIVVQADAGQWGARPTTGADIRSRVIVHAGARFVHGANRRVAFFWQATGGVINSIHLGVGAGLGLQVRIARGLSAKYQFDLHEDNPLKGRERYSRHYAGIVIRMGKLGN